MPNLSPLKTAANANTPPPRTPAAQAAPAEFGFLDGAADASGFAAALDLACGPLCIDDAALVNVDGLAPPAIGEAGDKAGAALDPAQLDLSALLPGWPPAISPPLPAPAAAPASDPTKGRGTPADAALAAAESRTTREWRHDLHAAAFAAREATAGPATPGGEHERRSADAPATPAATTEPLLPLPALHAAKHAAENITPIVIAALAQAPAAPTMASAHSAAPTAQMLEARITVPLDSPAFAPALATQVSWLAGEGVQQARLTLNPAEMGPLTVKIVLEGTQARIDFSAELAGTRGAIEASLPTLAAALNDQGLTLAGGGVFDGQGRHGAAREREAQAPQQGPAGNATAARSTPRTSSNAAQHNARGLVDLVA